ncbi:MAG TPA: spore germination protein GerPE [Bacilli bacterium]
MRVSLVDAVKVNNVGLDSVLFIGDNLVLNPKISAVAVHQREPVYVGDINEFTPQIFRLPEVWFRDKETVRLRVRHTQPVIHVNVVDVLAVSAASILQIGSTHTIRPESRVKHARRVLD